MKQTNQTTLSQKRYAIARITTYLSLIIIIVVLFLPIIEIYAEEDGMRASASISMWELITDNTEKELNIKIDDDSESSELLTSIFKPHTVNVAEEMMSSRVYRYVKIMIIGTCILEAVLVIPTNISKSKKIIKEGKTPAELQFQNQLYITRVYHTLPTPFEIIRTFISILNITILSYALIMSFVIPISDLSVNFQINHVPLIITFILSIVLNNGLLATIICASDIGNIKDNNARFDEPYENPTIVSDYLAIAALFTNKQPVNKIPTNDSTDELYKYKKLLDDGIITEEEFQAKKVEIINIKTND